MSCKKEKKDCGCKKPCNEDLLGCTHYHSTDCITGNGIIGNQPNGTSVTNILKNFWTYFQDNLAEDGVSVTGAVVNGSGNLIITLSDGNTINAGYVKGADGVGISNTSIINDELIITLTDGTIFNLGNVKGADGQDAIGIQNTQVNSNGDLIVTLTDNTSINAGFVKGADGLNGVGVESIEINGDNIEITYTDSSTETIGAVSELNGNHVVANLALGTAYNVPVTLDNWTSVISTGAYPLGNSPNCWKITYAFAVGVNVTAELKIDGHLGTGGLSLGTIVTTSIAKDVHLEVIVSRRAFNTSPSWDIVYKVQSRDTVNNLFTTIINRPSGVFESGTKFFKYAETGIGTLGGGITLYKKITSGSTTGIDDRITLIERLKN